MFDSDRPFVPAGESPDIPSVIVEKVNDFAEREQKDEETPFVF